MSVPSPEKFWMYTPGVLVGVSVALPSNDPSIEPAYAGAIRNAVTKTRSRGAARRRKLTMWKTGRKGCMLGSMGDVLLQCEFAS